MSEFHFENPRCVLCGAEVRAIVERLVCYALLQPADDGGHDYADETKLDWDSQHVEVSSGGECLLLGVCDHIWPSAFEVPPVSRLCPLLPQPFHPRRLIVADNFLLFAESLTELTPDEEAWLGDRLAGKNEESNDPPAYDDDDSSGSFDFEFYSHSPDSRNLKLYAIEAGDPDAAAQFVQEFLRRFRPQASFGLSWCASCSKMRDGEFGGGAIFVTTERIETWSSGEWLVERERAFQANRHAASLNS